jgi:hypothetical protein
MATINLGRIKPVFKGAYASGTAYVVDDIVVYSDESYICIQAGTGQTPSSATAYWTKMAAKGTDGTNVATTLTTQGDILYRDGSGLARLGYGTAGQVLQTGGSGANPSWGTVSSDFVLLGTTTPTTLSSAIAIDGYFSSTYDHYKVIINGIFLNSIANSDYELKMRVNMGGTPQTSALYGRGWVRSDISSSGGNISAAAYGYTGDHLMFNYGSTVAGYEACAEFDIFDPLNTSHYKKIMGRSLGTYDNNTHNFGDNFAIYKSTSALSGITIFTNNQIKASQVKIYGIK